MKRVAAAMLAAWTFRLLYVATLLTALAVVWSGDPYAGGMMCSGALIMFALRENR